MKYAYIFPGRAISWLSAIQAAGSCRSSQGLLGLSWQ